MSDGRWIWDVTTTLAALGAGEAALWAWTPAEDRLQLTGAVRALGLGPLAVGVLSDVLGARMGDALGLRWALATAALSSLVAAAIFAYGARALPRETLS